MSVAPSDMSRMLMQGAAVDGRQRDVTLGQVASGEAILGPTSSDDGRSGGAETDLQYLLGDAGFPPYGGADGWYGPCTEAAVMQFQAANGLPVTGVVDQATLTALQTGFQPTGQPIVRGPDQPVTEADALPVEAGGVSQTGAGSGEVSATDASVPAGTGNPYAPSPEVVATVDVLLPPNATEEQRREAYRVAQERVNERRGIGGGGIAEGHEAAAIAHALEEEGIQMRFDPDVVSRVDRLAGGDATPQQKEAAYIAVQAYKDGGGDLGDREGVEQAMALAGVPVAGESTAGTGDSDGSQPTVAGSDPEVVILEPGEDPPPRAPGRVASAQ